MNQSLQVQPTWVNESLDDEENVGQGATGVASVDMNVEGAFNPLAVNTEVDENPLTMDSGISNPLESGAANAQDNSMSNPLDVGVTESQGGEVSNPLENELSNPPDGGVSNTLHSSVSNQLEGMVTQPLDTGINDSLDGGLVVTTPVVEEGTAAPSEPVIPQAQVEQQPLNEEDALLATATEQPPFVNECQEEGEAVIDGAGLLEGGSDNPLGGVDGHENETAGVKSSETDPFSSSSDQQTGEKPAEQCEQSALSEEDLLTGPAHNLDDTQYKADYVDPNLDDIFK